MLIGMVELAKSHLLFHCVVEAVKGITYPEVKVKANVPAPVIGLPDIDSPVGTLISTEETVPAPAKPSVEVETQSGIVPFVFKI